MYVIEDDFHAEEIAEFAEREGAEEELRRIAVIPWGQPPNCPPCMSWRTCHREYVLIEYDATVTPRNEVSRTPIFEISANGIVWIRVHQSHAT